MVEAEAEGEWVFRTPGGKTEGPYTLAELRVLLKKCVQCVHCSMLSPNDVSEKRAPALKLGSLHSALGCTLFGVLVGCMRKRSVGGQI